MLPVVPTQWIAQPRALDLDDVRTEVTEHRRGHRASDEVSDIQNADSGEKALRWRNGASPFGSAAMTRRALWLDARLGGTGHDTYGYNLHEMRKPM
jgi:hypothetical protein